MFRFSQIIILFGVLLLGVSCSDQSAGTTTETTNGIILVKGNVLDSTSIHPVNNSLVKLKKIKRKNQLEEHFEKLIDSTYSDSEGYFEFEIPLDVEEYVISSQDDSLNVKWQVLGKRNDLQIENPQLEAKLQRASSLGISYDWPKLPFKKELFIVGTGILVEADSNGAFWVSGIPPGEQEVILRLYNSELDSYSHILDTLLDFKPGDTMNVGEVKPPVFLNDGDSLWLDRFEDGDEKNELQSSWYYFDDRSEGGTSEIIQANEGTWLGENGYQESEGSAAFRYKLKNEPLAYVGFGVIWGSNDKERVFNLDNLKYVKLMIKGNGKFLVKICLDGSVFPVPLCSDVGGYEQENKWIGKAAGNFSTLIDWSENLKNRGITESELLKVATKLNIVIYPDGEDSEGDFSLDDIRLITGP